MHSSYIHPTMNVIITLLLFMSITQTLTDLSDRIERTANVRIAFGDPYSDSGVTIIPVAKVTLAGGGGGGEGHTEEKRTEEPEKGGGMGLGLHLTTTPLGYIQIHDGKAKFIPIKDKTKITLAALAIAGIATVVGIKTVMRMDKKCKRSQ